METADQSGDTEKEVRPELVPEESERSLGVRKCSWQREQHVLICCEMKGLKRKGSQSGLGWSSQRELGVNQVGGGGCGTDYAA